jgi:hypothetical protein
MGGFHLTLNQNAGENVKVRMFEPLQPDTAVREHMTYKAGSDLLVTFNHRNAQPGDKTPEPGNYGFDLYDFDDLIFQTSRGFFTLEEAKRAALSAAATLEDA